MPNQSVFARRRSAARGVSERLSDGFNMVKVWRGRTLTTTCETWTHQLGWELRLLIDGQELRMARVVRSDAEMANTIAEWRTAMTALGWG